MNSTASFIPRSTSNASSRSAHLMMRYHAPLDDFDRHLARVMDICREAKIGEVAFFIDPEEHFSGLPSLARIKTWAERFTTAGRMLRDNGVLMSINPWMTLGHGGRPFAPAGELALTAMMTGDDGAVSIDTACPADPMWQQYIAQAYSILARAAPEILWIEDDFRLHNHGAVSYGCFARPMLDDFERRTGRRWTRDALVHAIVAGGEVRTQWLRFTGDLWNENVTRIRTAVHQVNPNVKLAQMTSAMAAHAVEGRRWREYLSAMAGPHEWITRPHFGPYRNASGFDFAEGLVLFRHSLAMAGRKTRFCTEVENWPYSYFSKSMRQTRLTMELSQYFGCVDAAFNLFSLAGNDPSDEPWVMQTLTQARPRLDALAAMNLHRRVERGVHVWTHEDAALHQRVDDQAPRRIESLRPAFDAWGRIFSRMAIASTFETRGALTAVSGDTIRAADDAEIRRLLSGGLLLDGRAAWALQEMGHGRHLGVRMTPPVDSAKTRLATIERITDFQFGPQTSPAMACAMMGSSWRDCRIHHAEGSGASIVSRFESPDHAPLAPAVTVFENALGGRVAIFSYDFDSGVADNVRFFNPTRKQQLQQVVRWLNRGRPLIASCDAAMTCIEQCSVDGQEILAIVNLNGDAIEHVTIEMPSPPRCVSILDDSGAWIESKVRTGQRNGAIQVTFPSPMEAMQVCFIKWASSRTSSENA